MNKKLEMTEYLKGLKELLDRCGINEVYSEYKFANEREDGVVLYADCDTETQRMLSEYIDGHDKDIPVLPEQYSFVLKLYEQDKPDIRCIYKDGIFYE